MIEIDKEWAAVEGDRVVHRADTKARLRSDLAKQGDDPDDYEIIALPKSYGGIWI